MNKMTFTFDELRNEFLDLFFFAKRKKLFSKNSCDAEEAIENYVLDKFLSLEE